MYEEDGVIVYRASSVGMCDEALLAIRQGVEPVDPPEWMLEKYREGTEAEAEIVAGAVKYVEGELLSTQDTVEVEVASNIIIRGHTDGRMEVGAEDGHGHSLVQYGVEAKKLGPALFKYWQQGLDAFWEKMPYYRDQLTIYMTTGLPYVYAVGEWDADVKMVKMVHSRIITTPPGDINTIKAKILRTEMRYARGDEVRCDGKAMWPCPVYFLHEEEGRTDEAHSTALVEATERWLNAAAQEKAAKASKDAAYEEVFVLMQDKDDEVVIPNLAILTKYEHVSSSQDKELAKADGVDLAKYRKTTTKTRVKITSKE